MDRKISEEIAREFHEKSLESLEKDSKRNALIVGIVLIVVGIAIIGGSISSGEPGAVVVGGMFSTVIIAFGVFLLNKKKMEKRRRELLKDENSVPYKKKQIRMEKVQMALRRKSGRHKSLKYETSKKFRVLAGVFMGIFVPFALMFIVSGEVPGVIVALAVISIICFMLTFLGIGHKKLLKQYLKYGLDENAAEEDFKESALYKGVAAVSSRFLTLFSPANVIAIEKIVWVFPKITYIYHYINGIYTGIDEKYNLMIYDEDGGCYSLECIEELCRVLIDDIIEKGVAVTAGFCDELSQLYASSPGEFRNAVKNFPMPSPYQMPPNEIKE